MITYAIRWIMALATALHTAWPAHVPLEAAPAHVWAAVAAASPDVPPSLLLAIARVETGFRSASVSRVDAAGDRVTGVVRGDRPAGVGPRFCGVMQAQAGGSWARCLALRDLSVAYQRGAEEIRYWMARGRGDVPRALCGHVAGNRGFRERGRACLRYAKKVLTAQAKLEGTP